MFSDPYYIPETGPLLKEEIRTSLYRYIYNTLSLGSLTSSLLFALFLSNIKTSSSILYYTMIFIFTDRVIGWFCVTFNVITTLFLILASLSSIILKLSNNHFYENAWKHNFHFHSVIFIPFLYSSFRSLRNLLMCFSRGRLFLLSICIETLFGPPIVNILILSILSFIKLCSMIYNYRINIQATHESFKIIQEAVNLDSSSNFLNFTGTYGRRRSNTPSEQVILFMSLFYIYYELHSEKIDLIFIFHFGLQFLGICGIFFIWWFFFPSFWRKVSDIICDTSTFEGSPIVFGFFNFRIGLLSSFLVVSIIFSYVWSFFVNFVLFLTWDLGGLYNFLSSFPFLSTENFFICFLLVYLPSILFYQSIQLSFTFYGYFLFYLFITSIVALPIVPGPILYKIFFLLLMFLIDSIRTIIRDDFNS